MDDGAREIAASFANAWGDAWNNGGAPAAARLYAEDSVLVGAAIGIGRREVERLLGALHQQGWTRIVVTVVDARRLDTVVLAVGEFVATGSGPNAGRTLNGKSSRVLTQIGGTWLSAMHTAA
jgi:uncharacterized protein (TIGR02246 family)